MNLQPRFSDVIVGQREFMRNTQGMEVKTAGASLQASDWAVGDLVPAGTAVYKDTTTKMYRRVLAGTAEATIVGGGLTMHDVRIQTGSNPIVGVLAAGHPRESRCTGVTAAFKNAVKGRISFDI